MDLAERRKVEALESIAAQLKRIADWFEENGKGNTNLNVETGILRLYDRKVEEP